MTSNPWDNVQQPSDDSVAGSPWFYVESYREFQEGLEALLAELESHRNVVQGLGLTSSPYEEEVGRIRGMVDWAKDRLESAGQSRHAEIIVRGATFGSLRYLKAGVLYRAFLVEKQKRDFLGKTKIVPKSVLQSFDARIVQLCNMDEMGKLKGLRPADVLFELLEADKGDDSSPTPTPRMKHALPVPNALGDIPIVDPILRKRCLAILGDLEGGGSAEQLDTVIREMSVILEDRVRDLTGFVGKASGAELFSATMAREPCLIRFSSDKDLQEAAHLFFRGYSAACHNQLK